MENKPPKKETTNFGDKRNTNGFSNPANRHKAGRPKKNKLADLIKSDIGEAVTPSQIQEVTAMLLNLSESELYDIADAKNKHPLFVCILAKALIADFKTKSTDTAIKLIERIAGRAPQSVEIRAEIIAKPNIENLNYEQKVQMLSLLSKIDDAPQSNSDDR